MKAFIVGFVVLIGLFAIGSMYRASQQASIEQSVPKDYSTLKRPEVRSACSLHTEWKMTDCQTADAKEVQIGMPELLVKLAWGKPDRVNTTTNANISRQQLVYGHEYLYIVSGVLVSMQTTSQ